MKAEDAIKELETWLAPLCTSAQYWDVTENDQRSINVYLTNEDGSTTSQIIFGAHCLWHIKETMLKATGEKE
jgi:hypothetical protein